MGNEENIEEGSEGNYRKRVLGDRDFFEKDSVNTRNSPYDVLSLLHYGPQDFSKNGEDVFTFIHNLPDDQTWPEPDPEDPLSIVDEMELSLAYQCNVSQESLLKYIHFNRHHNTLLIEHNAKMVKENRRLIDDIKQPALPVECKNYNVLDAPTRHFQKSGQNLCQGKECCDKVDMTHARHSDWKGPGWYRVSGAAGSKLIESPVEARKFCGTAYTGWLDGGHPTSAEGEVIRTVNFNDGSNPKRFPQSVKVINCNNEYFVYHLLDIKFCNLAYCTE